MTRITIHPRAQQPERGGACEVDPPGQPVRNARRFVADQFGHRERPLLVHQGGVFYHYDGTCWPALDDGELRARLYSYFDSKEYVVEVDGILEDRPFAPNRYKVADLVDALRAVVHVSVSTATPSWLQKSSIGEPLPADEIVACANGLVHVPTRVLFPHTPRFYVHHSIGFAFDSKTEQPARWLAFLEQLWPGDPESVATLQELFGYVVAGDTRLQKMFLLVGPKRSGKGTIARILKALIGAHNVAGPTLASLGTNFGLSPLIGKPVAIVADARLKTTDTSVVTERLLSISGEDTLTVDRKYLEPWTGQIPSRVLILSNELPKLSDSSGALASRFVMLTMNTSFYGKENVNLTAELSTELAAIFNWALDGLERLRARGRFLQPQSSDEAVRELEDLGSPIGAFVREECVVGGGFTVPCDALFAAWSRWCSENGRDHPGTSQVFGRDLRATCPGLRVAQPRMGDGTRYRAYEGIGLARNGTRAAPLYAQQRNAVGAAAAVDHIGSSRVPSRAGASADACPKCDDEGCPWCTVLPRT